MKKIRKEKIQLRKGLLLVVILLLIMTVVSGCTKEEETNRSERKKESETKEIEEAKYNFDNGALKLVYNEKKWLLHTFDTFGPDDEAYYLIFSLTDNDDLDWIDDNFFSIFMIPSDSRELPTTAEALYDWLEEMDAAEGFEYTNVKTKEYSKNEMDVVRYDFIVLQGEKRSYRKILFAENENGIVGVDIWMADKDNSLLMDTLMNSINLYAPVSEVDRSMLLVDGDDDAYEEDIEDNEYGEDSYNFEDYWNYEVELTEEEQAELYSMQGKYKYLVPGAVGYGDHVKLVYMADDSDYISMEGYLISGIEGVELTLQYAEDVTLEYLMDQQIAMFQAIKEVKGLMSDNTESYGDEYEIIDIGETDTALEKVIIYTHIVNGKEYDAFQQMIVTDLGDGMYLAVTAKLIPQYATKNLEKIMSEISDAYGMNFKNS